MAREVLFYAVGWCPRCRRVRAFLEAAGIPHREMDLDADPEASAALSALTGEGPRVPAVVVDGRLLPDVENETLARALGVPMVPDLDVFDVAILGGGPAGLTAAIYCARENLRTLVVERGLPGGQAALTAKIENYPGFPDPVGGAELMERVHRQARSFGAEIRTGEEVRFLKRADLFEIGTDAGVHRACSVIAATGAVYRRLGVPGEEKFTGRGVSFCAACDAPFFRGRELVVVGGGNSALQETIHLAAYASRITIVQLEDRLTASAILESRIRSLPSVEVLLAHEVTEVLGTSGVERVRVRGRATGESREIPCAGVFLFIGQTPTSGFLRDFAELDGGGFVVTDPATLETSVAGLFAAGDVRAGSSKQITAAVGEGTVASFMAAKYIARRRRGREGGA